MARKHVLLYACALAGAVICLCSCQKGRKGAIIVAVGEFKNESGVDAGLLDSLQSRITDSLANSGKFEVWERQRTGEFKSESGKEGGFRMTLAKEGHDEKTEATRETDGKLGFKGISAHDESSSSRKVNDRKFYFNLEYDGKSPGPKLPAADYIAYGSVLSLGTDGKSQSINGVALTRQAVTVGLQLRIANAKRGISSRRKRSRFQEARNGRLRAPPRRRWI